MDRRQSAMSSIVLVRPSWEATRDSATTLNPSVVQTLQKVNIFGTETAATSQIINREVSISQLSINQPIQSIEMNLYSATNNT